MRDERSWSLSNAKRNKKKKKSKEQDSSQAPRPLSMMASSSTGDSGSALPPAIRVRLYELFVQIEREFEALYVENLHLQERLQKSKNIGKCQDGQEYDHIATTATPHVISKTPSQQITSARGQYAHKLRSQTNKLRAQTNRFMSNLKGQALNCTLLRRYTGHKDGIWEVSVSRLGEPLIGTASADHTAMVWGVHSGRPLLHYTAHTGSVNSIRFHPDKELVLTASGDGSAHIWQCAVHVSNESRIEQQLVSSDDEAELVDKELGGWGPIDDDSQLSILRTPLRALAGHNGVVIAADWLPGGDQVVTAGWDKLACIWDTQTGQLLHQLSGHDEELTHVSSHPSARLVVTSSKDSTFRLWDFRESIHSVSVFQGHQETVTSAVFASQEATQIVSGSDDRSARIWDLRNMRTPVAVMQSDSSVNRLSVSSSGYVAIPFDNRNVRIYDLNGNRIARLPRSSRQGHSRMVCCTAWSEETRKPNLFTCGFDRVTLGWGIQPREVKDDHGKSSSAKRLDTSVGRELRHSYIKE